MQKPVLNILVFFDAHFYKNEVIQHKKMGTYKVPILKSHNLKSLNYADIQTN